MNQIFLKPILIIYPENINGVSQGASSEQIYTELTSKPTINAEKSEKHCFFG
jgi:hypothetical protein